jgi:hypothetical protein
MWTKDQSDNPRRWYALLVFAVLQAGDYLSTRLALASPSMVELNPIVRYVGLWEIKVIGLIGLTLLIWWGKQMRAIWIVNIVFIFVILNNLMWTVINSLGRIDVT